MADSPMMLERLRLWGMRNLAVVYVVVGTLVFLVVALLWYGYGPVTMARLWGVTHGHAATYQRAKVKLPAGWREEDGVARSDLHLVRPYAWREKIETVDVNEFTGNDVDFDRTMNTLRSLEKLATDSGEVSVEYPLRGSNAERFVCVGHGDADHTTLEVTCLTKDGKRVARMVGDESTGTDFAVILTALAGVR